MIMLLLMIYSRTQNINFAFPSPWIRPIYQRPNIRSAKCRLFHSVFIIHFDVSTVSILWLQWILPFNVKQCVWCLNNNVDLRNACKGEHDLFSFFRIKITVSVECQPRYFPLLKKRWEDQQWRPFDDKQARIKPSQLTIKIVQTLKYKAPNCRARLQLRPSFRI